VPGIKVLIVDPHRLPREGLRFLLARERYNVIGATASLEAALADIEGGGRPALLIAVLRDSEESFESTTLQRIRAIVPECKVVLIASTIASSLPARASEWGVNALLRSDMSEDVLTHSLRLAMQGQAIFPASSSMPPDDPDEDAGDTAETAAARLIRHFSDLEARILHHLVAGHSNKAIARELAIREATVKIHMKGLLRKLDVHSRTQAAIWALANGFFEKSADPSSPDRSRPVDTTDEPGGEGG
jgi:two-component system nitrate/nitrite response regulator NarL